MYVTRYCIARSRPYGFLATVSQRFGCNLGRCMNRGVVVLEGFGERFSSMSYKSRRAFVNITRGMKLGGSSACVWKTYL